MLFVWILKLLKIFTVKLVLLIWSWGLSVGWVFYSFNVLREYLVFSLRNLLLRVRQVHLTWGEWRRVVVGLLVNTIFLRLSTRIWILVTIRLMVLLILLDLRGTIDLIRVHLTPTVVAGAAGDTAVIKPLVLLVCLRDVRLNYFWIWVDLSVSILICDSVIPIWVYWCVLRIWIHLLYLLFAHSVDGPREPIPRVHMLLIYCWYSVGVYSNALV